VAHPLDDGEEQGGAEVGGGVDGGGGEGQEEARVSKAAAVVRVNGSGRRRARGPAGLPLAAGEGGGSFMGGVRSPSSVLPSPLLLSPMPLVSLLAGCGVGEAEVEDEGEGEGEEPASILRSLNVVKL